MIPPARFPFYPKILNLLASTLLGCSFVSAADDASKVQDPPSEERLTAAQHVLEVKGTRQQMKDACILGLDSQLKTNPDMSQAMYHALKEEFTKDANIDALLKITAVSMAKRFNPDELKELAAFYGTALGKRLAAEEAAIAVEGMTAGQEWGRKIGESVEKSLHQKKELN